MVPRCSSNGPPRMGRPSSSYGVGTPLHTLWAHCWLAVGGGGGSGPRARACVPARACGVCLSAVQARETRASDARRRRRTLTRCRRCSAGADLRCRRPSPGRLSFAFRAFASRAYFVFSRGFSRAGTPLSVGACAAARGVQRARRERRPAGRPYPLCLYHKIVYLSAI
jgi:hypothetical protein